MRIGILKSAVLAALLSATTACSHQKKIANRLPATSEATATTTEPSTEPASTEPVTVPSSPPTTEAIVPPVIVPTSEPAAIQPAETVPVTQPAAATEPASQPAIEPATQSAAQTSAKAVAPFSPAPPTTNPLELQSDAALAEWVCSVAQISIPLKLESNELWQPTWKRVAAILQSAVKLNPTEPRFSRLLTDAQLQLQDVDGALAALAITRKSAPDDQFAQQQFVDLTLGKMETVDQKIAYLKFVLGWKGSPAVPDAIRSHAGVECAKLLFDRGENQTARNVLAEAVRLCPASVEGLRLRYAVLAANASNFERSELLMKLLLANPDQAGYAGLLADQIAGLGLVEESLPWYQAALMLGLRNGHPDIGLALRTAAEMFIAGQTSDAANLAEQLTKADPGNPMAWILRLSITHSAANKDDFNKVLTLARNAVSNRLIEIANQLGSGDAGGPQATTRPIAAEGAYTLPDLNVAILQANKGHPLKNEFVTALFHLSTIEIYFAQTPSSAEKLIGALKLLLPQDNPDLTRVLAWNDFASGKNDDAKSRFATIAARDPLAQLGLVKLAGAEPGERQTAQSMGRKLITDYPSGVVGAMLWDAMHDLKVAIIPSKEGDALRQELSEFPKDWLKILDQPQLFYQIHAEPVLIAREFGQPMLAELRIQNLGNQDLTVGPDGIIKRNLWFNAEVKGIAEQQMIGTAFDQYSGPIVLHGRSSTSQVIRLDQGRLKDFLASNPVIAMQVNGSVMTNPSSGPGGQLMSSPGGYTVRFTKPFSRQASPLEGSGPQQVMKELMTGTPDDKMAAINLLSAFAQIIHAQKETPDALKQAGANLSDAIDKARLDPIPSVSAWAGFTAFSLASASGRTDIIRDLAADPDWRHRMVAATVLGTVQPDLQREIEQELSTDPEPSVRNAALAWQEYHTIQATLPPTTEPAPPVAPAP